jgi:hypothetical protein
VHPTPTRQKLQKVTHNIQGFFYSYSKDRFGRPRQMNRMRRTPRQSFLRQLIQNIHQTNEIRPILFAERPTKHQNVLNKQQFDHCRSDSPDSLTLTSRDACKFAKGCFTPLPTCQIMASGGCDLNGHSLHNNSYHTVLKFHFLHMTSAHFFLPFIFYPKA